MGTMIEIQIKKELSASSGTIDLSVDLKIEKGQFIAIHGPSGAGKTSILRMLSGLMHPDSGSIQVNNNTWLDTSKKINIAPQNRSIGMVFQEYALFPNMTVKQNLEYALEKGQDKNSVTELIDLTELGDLQNKKPATLSGGQKQRVALARALVRQPSILLLDEPLSALDREMRSKLQDYILQMHQKYQLTTILISHDAGEVIKMADKVFVLESGKITRTGSPEEIFTSRQLSGKFQFTGEVLSIEKADIIYIVHLLIGNQTVQVIAQEKEVRELQKGDLVLVASKAFNPVLKKL